VTIMNTIVSGNVISGSTTADDLALQDTVTDHFISGGHNLIGTVDPNIVAFVDGVNGDQVGVNDPRLSPLADNGGPTLTHALLPDSPAIDAGDPTYPAQAGDYDQRGEGFDRVINGRLDIGSYELNQTCIIVVMNTLSSGVGTLRQAINDVCHGGLITFDALLSSQTIDISPDGELVISKSLTISGTVPITVSGGNAVRVFNVMTGTTPIVNVTLNGLMITNGNVQTSDCGAFSLLCGGGVMIQNNGVAIAIINSTLFNNAADNAGGGIFNYGGVLTIDGSIVNINGANTGSGIYNYQGVMGIEDSTISGNVWAIEGGGIFNQGMATIDNSTIISHSVDHDGGGIYNRGTLVITNSTVSDNSAGVIGGGVYSDFGSGLSINHSTFSGNMATGVVDGGGVYNHGIFHLSNTIIANTPNGDDCYSSVGLTTDVHNLIEESNGCGTPVSTDDPLLGALQDNGGSTLIHALLSGSPAIDAGDPAYSVLAGDYDQRGEGFDRVSNGRLDIGSYELQNETAVYSLTINVDGVGSVVCDGGCLETYPEGTVVTLTAVSTISSTFTGWSGAIVTTTNPITLTMGEAKALTATFAINTYDLSLIITGNGAGSVNFNPFDIDCTADCSHSYDHGTVVTLTTTADVGVFIGWSGACSGVDDCVITMDAEREMTAVFSLHTVFLPVIIK